MIARIAGDLVAVEAHRALIKPTGSGLTHEVLLPAFLAARLAVEAPKSIDLAAIEYLENQGNGSSYVPRLVGFATERERDFFELLTSVSGIGNRKALRAMSVPPEMIARAIVEKDAKFLATLPEIGKRMAERLITELAGKADVFCIPGASVVGTRMEVKTFARGPVLPRTHEQAVLTLVALGQTRADAEQALTRALVKHKDAAEKSAEQLVALVFAGA